MALFTEKKKSLIKIRIELRKILGVTVTGIKQNSIPSGSIINIKKVCKVANFLRLGKRNIQIYSHNVVLLFVIS